MMSMIVIRRLADENHDYQETGISFPLAISADAIQAGFDPLWEYVCYPGEGEIVFYYSGSNSNQNMTVIQRGRVMFKDTEDNRKLIYEKIFYMVSVYGFLESNMSKLVYSENIKARP